MIHELGSDPAEMLATISGWLEKEWDAFVEQCKEDGMPSPSAFTFKEFLQTNLNQ